MIAGLNARLESNIEQRSELQQELRDMKAQAQAREAAASGGKDEVHTALAEIVQTQKVQAAELRQQTLHAQSSARGHAIDDFRADLVKAKADAQEQQAEVLCSLPLITSTTALHLCSCFKPPLSPTTSTSPHHPHFPSPPPLSLTTPTAPHHLHFPSPPPLPINIPTPPHHPNFPSPPPLPLTTPTAPQHPHSPSPPPLPLATPTSPHHSHCPSPPPLPLNTSTSLHHLYFPSPPSLPLTTAPHHLSTPLLPQVLRLSVANAKLQYELEAAQSGRKTEAEHTLDAQRYGSVPFYLAVCGVVGAGRRGDFLDCCLRRCMHTESRSHARRFVDLSNELTVLRAELVRSKVGVEKAMADAETQSGKQKAWHAERRELVRALAAEQKRRDRAAADPSKGAASGSATPPPPPPRPSQGAPSTPDDAGLVGGLLRNLGGLLPTIMTAGKGDGRDCGGSVVAAPLMLGAPDAESLPAPATRSVLHTHSGSLHDASTYVVRVTGPGSGSSDEDA